jgi:hypothetical protein
MFSPVKNYKFKMLFFASFLMAFLGFSKESVKKENKAGHKAHVHGSAKLSIALETNKAGTILFESPADSIIGFEHEAKSAADIKSKEKALGILKQKANELFVFDKSKNCSITPSKFEVKKEDSQSEHTEVEIEYSFKCEKDLSDTNLQITIGKSFPKINDLDVQLVSDKKQNSLELEKGTGSIKF